MQYYETIIVGGGPAGSSCAWKLKKEGREVLILEKATFPRLKLCAGWITSKVMKDLEFTQEDYRYPILEMKSKMYIAPFSFPFGGWPTRWQDYSIRRVEFDNWLLERSQAPVINHQVKQIEKQGDQYILDRQYSCQYLIGAGGTNCPVRRNLFPNQRVKEEQLATLEKEFQYPQRKDIARLFFFFRGLKGYSWYVPKGDGHVNIGMGGYSSYFKKSGTTIHSHFKRFLNDLVKRDLLDQTTADELKPSGHTYYLFTYKGEIKKENSFLIGDSAGLASLDLGEGIGPAVESGLLVADEILGKNTYVKSATSRFSLNRAFQWVLEPFILKY